MAYKVKVDKSKLIKFILIILALVVLIMSIPLILEQYNRYQVSQNLINEKNKEIDAASIDKRFQEIIISDNDLDLLGKNEVLTVETITKLKSLVEVYQVTKTYESKLSIVTEYQEIRKAIDGKINEYIKKVKSEISTTIKKLSLKTETEKKHLRHYNVI